MQFFQALALLSVAILHMPVSVTRSDPVLVRSVTSGDAIQVQGVGHVRLLGIKTPARHRGELMPPFAQDARDRLTDLVLRHWVRLEGELMPGVGARWHAAYVWREDGVFVNAVLVREGLARVVARGGGSRLQELQRAQEEARTYRRGIWKEGRLEWVAPARKPQLYCSVGTALAVLASTGVRHTVCSSPS